MSTPPPKGGGGGDGGGGGGSKSWKEDLTVGRNGYASTPNNIGLFLRFDEGWNGVIRYDEFTHRVVFVRKPPFHTDYVMPEMPMDAQHRTKFVGKEVTDTDVTAVRVWLERAWKLRAAERDTISALELVARSMPIHPVKDFLEALQWDGVRRLGMVPSDGDAGAESWLTRYLGAEDSLYTRLVGRWWLMSAIARIYQPGCDAQYMLILEGLQGPGKSRFLRTLFSPWFSENLSDVNSKDGMQQLQGVWCIEVPEMDAIMRGGHNSAKRFLSTTVDRFRAPYGRLQRDYPRSCILCATTNDAGYLTDTTGNRRYWPVRIAQISIDRLIEEREQLFAEALVAYKSGEAWWPRDPAHIEMLTSEQNMRLEHEPWLLELRSWVYKHGALSRGPVSENDGLRHLGVEQERWDKKTAKVVQNCYRQIGLIRFSRLSSDGVSYEYVWTTRDRLPNATPPDSPSPSPPTDPDPPPPQQAFFDDDDWRDLLPHDQK